jgi:hypothetical protein
MGARSGSRDGLERVARRQSGVIASGQLAALGFTRHEIRGLVVGGFLRRLHRGVYIVG